MAVGQWRIDTPVHETEVSIDHEASARKGIFPVLGSSGLRCKWMFSCDTPWAGPYQSYRIRDTKHQKSLRPPRPQNLISNLESYLHAAAHTRHLTTHEPQNAASMTSTPPIHPTLRHLHEESPPAREGPLTVPGRQHKSRCRTVKDVVGGGVRISHIEISKFQDPEWSFSRLCFVYGGLAGL